MRRRTQEASPSRSSRYLHVCIVWLASSCNGRQLNLAVAFSPINQAMRYTQNNIGMPFLQRGGGGCDPLPANHGRLTATSSIHRPRVRWSSSRTAAAAAAVAKSNDDSAEVEAEYFSNRSFDDTTTTSVAVTPEIGSSTVIYDPTATPTFLAQMSGSEGNTNSNKKKKTNGGDPIVGVGGYDPSEGIDVDTEKLNVGNPQKLQLQEKEFSVTAILKELKAIQQQGPQKYCILGTRHCSYMHQQIIELLAYALVLSGNHVYTSGAGGTHAATIRGALRAERPELLTVVLPQSRVKQAPETQELLKLVVDVVEMPQNNDLSLDIASRICNSYLLSLTDQLISFAFHESSTVIEATKEAKKLDMLVTVLFLD